MKFKFLLSIFFSIVFCQRIINEIDNLGNIAVGDTKIYINLK